MKKLESTWYNMAIVLTLIAIVAAGLLAFVHSSTKDRIKEINRNNERNAIAQVLGGGEVEITDTIPYLYKEGTTDTIFVYKTNKGCAVKSFDPQNASFGGDLTVMIGFDDNGTILGYRILKTKETPGLGAKASTWFQTEGKGCIIGKVPGENGLGVKDKDPGGDVDAITASTITSRAFLRAVNVAYKACMQKDSNEGKEEEK